MRRRVVEPSDGWLFLGKRYATRAEYRRAVDADRERRRRILQSMGGEYGDVFDSAGEGNECERGAEPS